MTFPKQLTIATRGSALALRQTGIVADAIRAAHPGIEIDIRTVTTRGDRDARPFIDIGGKGLFVAEVEREVAEGRADVAVHSAKDLTASLAPGCALVCVPERGPVHDVVVGGGEGGGEQRLGMLPSGARVGTSSMRRRALLRHARPDLEVVDLRGNIDTRLRKVAEGQVAAAILAAAGIARLGSETSCGPLDPGEWVPAPAQGALAVEARSDRDDLRALLAPLSHPPSVAEVECERAFARTLEGGCSVPLGCLARCDGSTIVATGFLAGPDGERGLRDRISGPAGSAAGLGVELARAILASGGDELLEEIAEAPAAEPSPP